MNTIPEGCLLKLWGKADETVYPISYHPVVFHCIDCANVAGQLWDRFLSPAVKIKISSNCGLSEPDMKMWISFFSGCHDIGKITPGFQGILPGFRPTIEQTGLRVSDEYRIYHNALSAYILMRSDTIPFYPKLNEHLREGIAYSLGGHHGEFPTANDLIKIGMESGGVEWEAYQAECVRVLGNLYELNENKLPVPSGELDTFFIILSGITSVSDWIASNSDFFPYVAAESSIEEYAKMSKARAIKALDNLSFDLKKPTGKGVTFHDLFPKITPFPIQLAADRILERITEPSLIIIEAPMGEGKTEAAFLLEAHQASRNGNNGSYIALPTQATANQMFDRFKKFLETRDYGADINLHLLHGNAVLSDKYQSMIVDGSVGRESDNQLIANTWFTYRKRGLLSPFGVGTIDQALLSVLPIRHFFVRLFGLAGKTVIFDEVHAYDTYMTTILEELVTWLGALGSSVILLSATLPKNKSKSLMEKYSGHAIDLAMPEYPRISWVSHNSAGAEAFESASKRAGRPESVALKWINRSEALHKLKSNIKSGGHAACIFNTVSNAQLFFIEAERYFAGTGIQVHLLHAKFIFDERDAKEKDCISRYGPKGASKRAETISILISTQIIEQSLDLDFDLMITEFAPGDLLLQRMGRLHRHANNPRPRELGKPELWVIKPEKKQDGTFDFGLSEYIYPRYVLLRSLSALIELEELRIPADIPRLVEDIYNSDREPSDSTLANQLRAAKAEYESEIASMKNEAIRRVIFTPGIGEPIWLKFSDYQSDEDDVKLHDNFKALTRLTEPSLPVVCLYRTGNTLSLDKEGLHAIDPKAIPDEAHIRKLLGRSISLSRRDVISELLKADVPDGWKKSALLRNHRILELSPIDDSCAIGKYKITLDDTLGMRAVKNYGS